MDFANTTFIDILCHRAIHQPNQRVYIFLRDGEVPEYKLTYQELDRRAKAIGAWLQSVGAAKKCVLLLYPPGLEYITAFFGCLYAGACALPSYPPPLSRTDTRLHAIINDAQARIALTTTSVLSNLKRGCPHAQELETLHWKPTDELTSDWAEEWGNPGVTGDTLALLQYTSGSTATPKGVMVSHANLMHNSGLISRCFGHTPESRGVIWLPPYHDMGLIGGILQPLYSGFPVILMSPVAFLQNPFRWLQAISRYRATTSGGPNFAYDLCVRRISPEQRETLDLSSWEVAFNGAEPIHPDTLAQFAEMFASCGFRREALYPCYGLAEATLFVSGGPKEARPVLRRVNEESLKQHRIVDVQGEQDGGRSLVGCGGPQGGKIIIVDPETLNTCPPNQVGEVLISGPSVAQGYWRRQEETGQTFQAYVADTGEGPCLRTGDLGCLWHGELFLTGRLKDIIIVRGRNYYPHDIEFIVANSHPALEAGSGAAFSVAGEDDYAVTVSGKDERLVIVQELKRSHYRCVDIEDVAAAVRQAVAEEHGLHVSAIVLIKPMSLPKTSSGKVQRYAARTAFLQGSLKVVGSSVLGETADTTADPAPGEEELHRDALLTIAPEERGSLLTTFLKTKAAQVLKVPPSSLDVEQALVILGLDSLMVIDLQHSIQANLGVVIPVEDLLKEISVSQLAARILEDLNASLDWPLPPLHATTGSGEFPLSYEQERLWALDYLSPGNPAYHIVTAVRFVGPLDVEMLKRSLDHIVQRHDALRTSFVTRHGRPIQIITPTVEFPFPVIDLRDVPDIERETKARHVAAECTQRPFDLTQSPLMRAVLLRLDEATHIVVLTLHHIISDLWSLMVMIRELVELYHAFVTGNIPQLPELRVHYADFACWQRDSLQGTVLEERLTYWKERLANAPTRLWLPTDRPGQAKQSFRGNSYTFDLGPALTESLRKLSREEGVTVFMTMLAGFNMLLSRCSETEDLCVCTPTQGRIHPDLKNLIGFFAYPLVIRTDLSNNPTFRTLLGRIRDSVLGASAHQIPFSQLIKRLKPERRGTYIPLFHTMFSLIKSPLEDLELPGFRLDLVDVEREATDLDCFLTLIEQEDGLHGVLQYRVDIFDVEIIEEIVDFYRTILEKCTRCPETRLYDLEFPKGLAEKIAANNVHDHQQTIVIAATFTAEPIKDVLAYWMDKLDISSQIVFAPYNQVFQQLLAPESLFSNNTRGINVILVRIEDWQRIEDSTNVVAKIERNTDDFVRALRTMSEHASVPYLVCLCPASPDTLTDPQHAAFFTQMEKRLSSELQVIKGVSLITPEELLKHYPVEKYYDPYGDTAGHMPYTSAFFTALGTMITRKIAAIQRCPYKVIVLDCDQTLWQGVCGEDGPLGVQIDPPRKALQAFMVAQHDAGMLLCLCSKNNEADVLEVFDHREDMILTRDHLVSWRINWKPKSENLTSLSEEFGLGLNSFIFLDDDPIICAEVQANCPDVLTVRLPQEAESIPRFLDHIWAFDHVKVTEEDKKRTRFYQQNAAREQFKRESLTFRGFLADLELVVRIFELRSDYLERAAQLTQRTNQFNATTIRRSASELKALTVGGEKECLIVEVSDRFGDYGVVGVMIFNVNGETLAIDSFLLSCRALGRGVEHRMLSRLGEIAVERGVQWVDVLYIPTRKNQPVLEFLNSIGSNFKQPGTDDACLFHFPTTVAASTVYDP